ncbi:hypothetical protein ACQ4PT_020678 [Festuca glaucescens]
MSVDNVSSSTLSTFAPGHGSVHHLLKINGYSRTTLLLDNGMAARSCEFGAGKYCSTWRIMYYPNRASEEDAGGISLFVELMTIPSFAKASVENASVRFTLLPHHGKPTPATPHCVSFTRAVKLGCAVGQQLIAREELERSEYLLDDCFAIRCDIDVISMLALPVQIVPVDDLERMGLICSCKDHSCKRRHASPRTVVQATSSSSASASARTVEATSSSASASAPMALQSGIKSAWGRLLRPLTRLSKVSQLEGERVDDGALDRPLLPRQVKQVFRWIFVFDLVAVGMTLL